MSLEVLYVDEQTENVRSMLASAVGVSPRPSIMRFAKPSVRGRGGRGCVSALYAFDCNENGLSLIVLFYIIYAVSLYN